MVAAGEAGWQSDELLWIPLYAEDRLLGCLMVDDPKNGASPTLETIRSLEIFANQAVSAIETARSYNEAREQSVRDSLTEEVEMLVVDSKPEYERVLKFVAAFLPQFQGRIELYEGKEPIFVGFGIVVELDRALEK